MLVAASLLLYWPVRHYEFVNFDDFFYITQNPAVLNGWNWESIKWSFNGIHVVNWHPVTWLSHLLDVQLFGQKAGGHHLTNVLFHTLNTALLFAFFLRATGKAWPSAFVAALFAGHPLHVESVAWISERKDVLSTFFFFLTLLAYRRYTEKPAHFLKSGFYWSALGLFALGLMSKPMLVTLPIVLLLMDLWPLQRFQFSDLRSQPIRLLPLLAEKIPFFMLTVLFCWLTMWAQAKTVVSFPLGYRIANSFDGYLAYLSKMFWPVNLSPFYPCPQAAPVEGAVLGGLLILSITAVVLKYTYRRPYLLMGWLWFLVTLVPVIGIVKVGWQAYADRYTYIPLIGIAVMAAWAAAELSYGWKHRTLILATAATLMLAACAGLTSKQITYWHDTRTLFHHALKTDPNNFKALQIIGQVEYIDGNITTAANLYRRAIQIKPNDDASWLGLATCLNALGDSIAAEAAFKQSIALNPNEPQNFCSYAALLINLERWEEAQAKLDQSEKLQPGLLLARITRVALLQKNGQLVDAINECQNVLKYNPDENNVRIRLASLYSTIGKTKLAITNYQYALQHQPTNTDVQVDLGICLSQNQQFKESEATLLAVLKADPNHVRALDGLGFTLMQQGFFDEASAKFKTSFTLDPQRANPHMFYAISLTAQKQFLAAIAEYRTALRLDGKLSTALNNLAWLLTSNPDPKIRNGAEAVKLAEMACQVTSNQQPLFLGTLAAAYAEVSRFDDAINTAEKAQTLANQVGLQQVATRNKELLELYRTHQPFHESP